MASIDVSESIEIDSPVAVVRSQFADVAHHERVAPHRGVRFEVIDDGPSTCRYTQTTAVGPVKVTQHFRLDRTSSGPLVNTITGGFLEGGSITFDISGSPGGLTTVRAHVRAELPWFAVVAAPVLRRTTRSALAGALVEDKADIEQGGYPRGDGPAASEV